MKLSLSSLRLADSVTNAQYCGARPTHLCILTKCPTGVEMSRDNSELWQQALDDARFVREMLGMARQLAPSDPVGAIGCVSDALIRVESLRSRATQSSALLGAVLFYGIELEVRLRGLGDSPVSTRPKIIEMEIDRCDRLIASLASHIDDD